MNIDLNRMTWNLIGGGAAILAAMATRSVLEKSWRQVKKSEPPVNPQSRHVSWGDALLWTALTGAVVGMARLAAARGTALGWKQITGSEPPGED